MKIKLFKLSYVIVFLFFPSVLVFAAEKDGINFVIKNESTERVRANCGNFSYPGKWRDIQGQLNYKIEPAGFIWNPRKLQYTCSIDIPRIKIAYDVSTFYPDSFNHTLPNSQIELTIHSVDVNECYSSINAYSSQAFVVYSLSVDGKMIENKVGTCFYESRPID